MQESAAKAEDVRRFRSGEALVSRRRLEELLGRDWSDIERIADRAGRFYRPFDRRREKGRGKWRHIDNPTGELKVIQRNFTRRVLQAIPVPESMVGGVKGKGLTDNIRPHIGKDEVVGLDIRDCFPRTNDLQVAEVLAEHLRCPGEFVGILTKLTTFQHRLPQGAPSSPVLAALCLVPLHQEIVKVAAIFELDYSIYVDDITVSGPAARKVTERLIRLIHRFGYSVRNRKIKIMRRSERQVVTGGVVNRKLSVGRKKIERLRTLILELADQPEILERDLQSVRGKISSIGQISPAQGAVLQSLADRLLPRSGARGPRPRTDEIRKCRSFRRHRWEKQ